MLADVARTLVQDRWSVVVASPRDGPMRADFQALGVPVIVDSALFDAGEPAARDFARNFDLVLANTVVAWPAVRALAGETRVVWYVHEVGLVADLAARQPLLRETLRAPVELWAPSPAAAEALAAFGAHARLVPYGVDDPGLQAPSAPDHAPDRAPDHAPEHGDGRVRLCVLGGYEPRKGQDLAVEAWRRLPPELQASGELVLHGRDLDAAHLAAVRAAAAGVDGLRVEGELTHAQALDVVRASHAVLVPSREESVSLVALDALAAGRPVLCSARVGASAWLRDGVSGLVCAEPAPDALAALMARCIADAALRARVGAAGRAVFEREFTREAWSRRLLAAVGPGADSAV